MRLASDRAEEILEHYFGGRWRAYTTAEKLFPLIVDAINAAVLEEREECALVAENEPKSCDRYALPPQRRIAHAHNDRVKHQAVKSPKDQEEKPTEETAPPLLDGSSCHNFLSGTNRAES